MSKFSTFLVFLFGIFLMIAVAVIFTQKKFFSPPPVVEEKLDLPECSLVPLETGTREQFALQLATLALSGGLEAVRFYLEKELVPGRVLLARDMAYEPLSRRRLVDREMRLCDREGVAPLDKPPLLPRAAPILQMNGKVEIQTISRLEGAQPFVVRLWWAPAGAK